MTAPTVIVFGPTGHVGSVVTRAAHNHGARVVLAMRDPGKRIPGLSADEERQGGLERTQADLTQPESIKAAVTRTGAGRAFIYLMHESPDHMRSSLEALKQAGIEFVVFLSTAGLANHPEGLRGVTPANFIAYMHAQVEIGLSEIFGPEGYVAVRAGFFATNTLRWAPAIRTGHVGLPHIGARLDYTAEQDLGQVCGSLLVRGAAVADGGEKKTSVTILGPQLLSLKDAVAGIGKVLGQDIKLTELNDQEALQMFQSWGLPEAGAKHLLAMFALREKDELAGFPAGVWEEAVQNIQTYGGKSPTKWDEWVAIHKAEFAPE